MSRQNESITRFMAGWFRLLTLIQSLIVRLDTADRRASGEGRPAAATSTLAMHETPMDAGH
jgi:hypothetical protein